MIPEGEYGGGPMIVWDTGTWAPMGDVEESLAKGAFKFRLAGEKLNGGWMLARLKPQAGREQDQLAAVQGARPGRRRETDILAARPESVKIGPADRGAGRGRRSRSGKPAQSREAEAGRAARARSRAAMPARIEPQLATQVAEPPRRTTRLAARDQVDGYRTMAHSSTASGAADHPQRPRLDRALRRPGRRLRGAALPARR